MKNPLNPATKKHVTVQIVFNMYDLKKIDTYRKKHSIFKHLSREGFFRYLAMEEIKKPIKK